MTHRALNARHAIESCTLQLHSWRPFQLQTLTKTLESDQNYSPKNGFHCKRPCLSDRTTTFSIDNLDMSKLNIIEDERSSVASYNKRESFRWIARKRRRRGSRSVSGRSSDRSGTHRCCSVGASAAHATCSDFPVAAGTDSSGEFFVNGEANWSSDVSEARNTRKKEGKGKDNGGGEKENLGSGCLQIGVVDAQGNESGYGSEPGYRGDAEFGYGDELDEEEDDGRLLFWGGSRDKDCNMEMVEENTFSDQRAHYRCRRKKHDWRMVDLPRNLYLLLSQCKQLGSEQCKNPANENLLESRDDLGILAMTTTLMHQVPEIKFTCRHWSRGSRTIDEEANTIKSESIGIYIALVKSVLNLGREMEPGFFPSLQCRGFPETKLLHFSDPSMQQGDLIHDHDVSNMES